MNSEFILLLTNAFDFGQIMLLDVFFAGKRIFLVLEYAANGSLQDYYASEIAKHKATPHLGEELARYYFREVMRGLNHFHQQRVAHR